MLGLILAAFTMLVCIKIALDIFAEGPWRFWDAILSIVYGAIGAAIIVSVPMWQVGR